MDDVYGAGHRKKLQEIASAIQSKYKATLAWLIEPGDCISFLKRSYELLDEETLVMRPHSKHVERLVGMLHLEPRRAKATPMPTAVPLDSTPLDEEQAGTFRSAVGILLYLAPDAIECQNCIRLLSQQMSAPTVGGLKLLKHLVCYLKSVTGYGLAFGIAASEEGTHFKCGRKISTSYAICEHLPNVLFPVCKQCCPDFKNTEIGGEGDGRL